MQVTSMIAEFKEYTFLKTTRQTIILYSSQLIGMALGIVSSSLNTRLLGPKGYGILAFFGMITEFIVLFFRFGFFSTGTLLLAHEKNELRERELIGALIVIGFIIGISFSLCMFIISFFIDKIFHTNVGRLLKILSPLLVFIPYQLLIPSIAKGTNKIGLLSLSNILYRVFYIAALLLLLLFYRPINYVIIITISLIKTIIVEIIVILNFKPYFTNLKYNLKKIWKENKKYGIYLYLGQIADQTTYQLDNLLISYFLDTTQLGFYALANMLVLPLVMFSKSLSGSIFKKFADKDKIPKKIIQLNFIYLLFGMLGLMIFGKYIVILLFSEKFMPIVYLIFPLSLAAFFQGMYQPYNAFLGAHGKGKCLKNMSIIASITNIISNVILIPLLGTIGAAIASFISRGVSFVFYLRYYKKMMN